MAQAGIFTLITNDGKMDKIMIGMDRLLKRLKDIEANNIRKIYNDDPSLTNEQIASMASIYLPSIEDIEQTHIFFTQATFKPFVSIAHSYMKSNTKSGAANFGSKFSFIIPSNGDFVSDCALYFKIEGLRAVDPSDKVKYYDYVGHRILKNVALKVQGTEICSYDSDIQNIQLQYNVATGKLPGYYRMIGQEVPIPGYLTADPTVDEVRQLLWFTNGYQTAKNVQPTLELWMPVWFWFKDIYSALPISQMPTQQVEIEVTLEEVSKFVSYATYGGDGSYVAPSITAATLYANQIYTAQEIMRIIRLKVDWQIFRLFKKQVTPVTMPQGEILLNLLKFPTEQIYVGFRPQSNLTSSQNWYKNAKITTNTYKCAVVTGVATVQVNDAVYYTSDQCVSQLSLSAETIDLYEPTKPEFYNNYLPFQYGDQLKTPDIGWLLMNFNHFPGLFQPSGYINFSRTRKLFLNYTSNTNPDGTNIISSSNVVDAIVVGQCFNFLVFADKTATVRYAT